MAEKRLFACRIDELPVIGGFLYGSLVRDEADFVPYVAFADPFSDNYLIQSGLVEAAVHPVVLISQLKLLTFNLLTKTFGLRETVNKAEIFYLSAGSALNVKPKDMGQRGVRTAIGRGDVEQLIGALRTMNQNIANNSAVLIAQGFLLIMQTALADLTTSINDDNNAQNALASLRANTTNENIILYNGYWSTYMSPTRTTGQLIYKENNKTKAKDYTMSLLVKRIRNDQKQTEVFGVVTDGAGAFQNKAKVKLIPIDGGRTKTVYTNADGRYRMNGMRATDYNQVVTIGVLVKVTPVSVITRAHLEVNVVVE